MTKLHAQEEGLIWNRAMANAVDFHARESFLIPSLALMERAGHAVSEVIRGKIARHPALGHRILVLTGPGNNGGDALVAARHLSEAGFACHVVTVASSSTPCLSEARLLQGRILERLGHSLHVYQPHCLLKWREEASTDHVWILDGVFGLGGRALGEGDTPFHMVLREASQLADATVVAVDLPSGLDGDDGAQSKGLLPSDLTITFGAPKPVHVLAPARDLCGEVVVKDIGFPQGAVEKARMECPPSWRISPASHSLADNPWAKLKPSSHKYDRGHVLIIGGSGGKAGAPLLTGISALRTGAGWVSISMPRTAISTLYGEVPRELVFESLFQTDPAHEECIDVTKLRSFLAQGRVRSLVIGPGTMKNPLTEESLACIEDFCCQGGFAVFDAGACHHLVTLLEKRKLPRASAKAWVLTPHPGEWLRLGLKDQRPPLDPVSHKTVSQLASQLGITMVYKGATPTLYNGQEDLPAWVLAEGSKILARAGSGDVFAGIVGAHGAMGIPADRAVLRSYALLAKASQEAAKKRGPDAVLAHDIMDEIGTTLTFTNF